MLSSSSRDVIFWKNFWLTSQNYHESQSRAVTYFSWPFHPGGLDDPAEKVLLTYLIYSFLWNHNCENDRGGWLQLESKIIFSQYVKVSESSKEKWQRCWITAWNKYYFFLNMLMFKKSQQKNGRGGWLQLEATIHLLVYLCLRNTNCEHGRGGWLQLEASILGKSSGLRWGTSTVRWTGGRRLPN